MEFLELQTMWENYYTQITICNSRNNDNILDNNVSINDDTLNGSSSLYFINQLCVAYSKCRWQLNAPQATYNINFIQKHQADGVDIPIENGYN